MAQCSRRRRCVALAAAIWSARWRGVLLTGYLRYNSRLFFSWPSHVRRLDCRGRRSRAPPHFRHYFSPDAGKTTLTEKLLLFSGAIQMAGTVKGKKSGKFATSDWMEIEKQRGISVASSVMQFDYREHVVNLLDTPGHQDFSEDTYRVLTAVDAALMVIDAAKGVEAQTIKLLNVCRLRTTPIVTFMNKYDRKCAIRWSCWTKSKTCSTSVARRSPGRLAWARLSVACIT